SVLPKGQRAWSGGVGRNCLKRAILPEENGVTAVPKFGGTDRLDGYADVTVDDRGRARISLTPVASVRGLHPEDREVRGDALELGQRGAAPDRQVGPGARGDLQVPPQDGRASARVDLHQAY